MHVVCIGGGTGLYTLLSGVRRHIPKAEVSAVVTMMDSGGSTGRLRDEFGYLPPGDIRQSLVALSEAPLELRQLMQHRFSAPTSGLHGHTVGNILLTALKDLHQGDEYAAIEAMERLLRIKGHVYPVTIDNCHLVATLEDGTTIIGETNIDIPKHDASLCIKSLHLEPKGKIFSMTKNVLEIADIVVIGPGDLYTSLLPNLIVEGVIDALKRCKQKGGKIIYVINTMTKNGETTNYAATDFYNVIKDALDGVSVDAVLVNNGPISPEQKIAYERECAKPVVNNLQDTTTKVIAADLVRKNAFARHDPDKLGTIIAKIASEYSSS